MSELYVVTAGSYSDYGIRAIFMDKSEAEAYHKDLLLVDSDTNDIEVWSEGRPSGQKECRRAYQARIKVYDGHIDSENYGSLYEWVDENARTEQSAAEYPLENGYYPDDLYLKSFVSQEHAEKLAVEARQGLLRRASERGIVIQSYFERKKANRSHW